MSHLSCVSHTYTPFKPETPISEALCYPRPVDQQGQRSGMGNGGEVSGTAGPELIGSVLGMEPPVRLPWQMGAETGPPAKAQLPCPNQPRH